MLYNVNSLLIGFGLEALQVADPIFISGSQTKYFPSKLRQCILAQVTPSAKAWLKVKKVMVVVFDMCRKRFYPSELLFLSDEGPTLETL